MFKLKTTLIRQLIIKSGFTAKEFAARAGLNALTVSRLIKGDTAKASIKILGKLAKALNVDSEELIILEK